MSETAELVKANAETVRQLTELVTKLVDALLYGRSQPSTPVFVETQPASSDPIHEPVETNFMEGMPNINAMGLGQPPVWKHY